MHWDIAGLGNALIDALVVVDDDALVADLGLNRGTMHLVDHERWQQVYERIRLNKVTFDSGGSCANAIATAGWLGATATYTGHVGDDQMGRMYAERLTEACGKHHLRVAASGPTGKCLSIVSSRDAERTMLTDLGAAVSLPDLGEYADVLKNTGIAHFTGYTLLDGPMRDLTIEAMDLAHAAGATVSLDVADPFVVSSTRDLLWTLFEKYVDVAFLNAEAAAVLAEAPPASALSMVAERADVGTVVVKLGARGSLVRQDNAVHAIDVFPVTAVDTTGAGDAYAGAFLYGLSQGFAPATCGRLASAVAAQTVSQIGAVVKDRALLASILADIAPSLPSR